MWVPLGAKIGRTVLRWTQALGGSCLCIFHLLKRRPCMVHPTKDKQKKGKEKRMERAKVAYYRRRRSTSLTFVFFYVFSFTVFFSMSFGSVYTFVRFGARMNLR